MDFNILTFNFDNSDVRLGGLDRHITYLRNAISKCGHSAMVTPHNFIPSAINLFFEHFHDKDVAADIIEYKNKNNLKIGIINTELVLDRTIPYAKHGMTYYNTNTTNPIDRRLSLLEHVAAKADFVWSYLQRTSENFTNICKVSEMFPVGYNYVLPKEFRNSPKDIDILFFGKRTPHRERVVKDLFGKGLQVVVIGGGWGEGWFSDAMLCSLIDRAKIGLNLTLHDVNDTVGKIDPRFASCMRIVEMLERDLFILSEEIPLDNPYKPYMLSISLEKIAGTAAEILKTGQWQELGIKNAEKFRQEMDAVKICKPVIERTLKAIGG